MVRAGDEPGCRNIKLAAASLMFLLLASVGIICGSLGGAVALDGGSGLESRDDPVEELRLYAQSMLGAEATAGKDFDKKYEGPGGINLNVIAAGFGAPPWADLVKTDGNSVVELRNYVHQ